MSRRRSAIRLVLIGVAAVAVPVLGLFLIGGLLDAINAAEQRLAATEPTGLFDETERNRQRKP